MNLHWLPVFDSALSNAKQHTVRRQVKAEISFLPQSFHTALAKMQGTTELVFFFTHCAESWHIYELRRVWTRKQENWVPASIMQLIKTNKSNPCPNAAGQGSPHYPTEGENKGGLLHFHSDYLCVPKLKLTIMRKSMLLWNEHACFYSHLFCLLCHQSRKVKKQFSVQVRGWRDDGQTLTLGCGTTISNSTSISSG